MKHLFRSLLLLFIATSSGLAQNQLAESLPNYPDWMYEKRLEELNKNTPIQLDYNAQVQAYIDVYTVKRRDHLANIIGRSTVYFPLFEDYLSRYELPQELKYLAIVESALDPCAKSKSGAMGLWQFLYSASKMFDLKVDSYVDERCDPIKSTEAACKYLRYLHDNLNDWQLALAAYNGGIGVVQKAIERSGGKTNFWELQPYLPAEVKSYVPAFIAVNYVMNNYDKHDVTPKAPLLKHHEIDTVYIHKPLDFVQISKASETDLATIKWLNPSFIKDFVPAFDTPVCIYLPKNNTLKFVKAEKMLKAKPRPIASSSPIGDTSNRSKGTHVVAKGEYFHKIAINYRCRISDIMHWNKMTDRTLFAGQSLIVWQLNPASQHFFVTEEFRSPEQLNWRQSLIANENNNTNN